MTINVWGRNYRKVMYGVGKTLCREVREHLDNHGTISADYVAQLSVKYDLPTKTTFELLEHDSILPSGTWERLGASNQKAIRQHRKELANQIKREALKP